MTATPAYLEFAPPPPPGTGRSLGLALLVHFLLMVALTAGIQWKQDNNLSVEAELWAAIPMAAAPKPLEVEPPPPPPPPPPMNTAFLGVMTEAAENTKGAIINSVSEASPAQKAGLKEKDIITKLNDKIIDGPNTLYEAVGEFKPEEKVNITYLREGKEKKTTAVLEKNKNVASNNNIYFNAPNGMMPNNLRRGFGISPSNDFNFEMPELRSLDGLTGQLNRKPKLGISIEDLETGEGVKVKSVNEASPAEKAGFKANDIIVMFDDKKVTDVNDLKWEFIQEGQTLKFTVQRGGERKNIEVKIPKKLKLMNNFMESIMIQQLI